MHPQYYMIYFTQRFKTIFFTAIWLPYSQPLLWGQPHSPAVNHCIFQVLT